MQLGAQQLEVLGGSYGPHTFRW